MIVAELQMATDQPESSLNHPKQSATILFRRVPDLWISTRTVTPQYKAATLGAQMRSSESWGESGSIRNGILGHDGTGLRAWLNGSSRSLRMQARSESTPHMAVLQQGVVPAHYSPVRTIS